MSTVAEFLDKLTAPGELYEKLEDKAVRCTPAHTAAWCGRGGAASARCASTGVGCCMCPGAMWRGCRPTRSRKSPSTTCYPGEDGADLWHAGLRFSLRFLSELAVISGFARPGGERVRQLHPPDHARADGAGGAAHGRESDRLVVQRAADHLGVGGGDLQAWRCRQG